jgi:hypothetical protein
LAENVSAQVVNHTTAAEVDSGLPAVAPSRDVGGSGVL